MRIIIIQSEIETAIRDYVQSQVTINDDQQIDIDLKATRGDDGYQAVIDIVPKKATRGAAKTTATVRSDPEAPVTQEAPPAKAPAIKATTKATRKPKEATAAPAPQPEPEVEQQTTSDAEPDMSAEADAESQTIEDGDQTVADIAAEGTAEASSGDAPRTSLFAGLAAPTNS